MPVIDTAPAIRVRGLVKSFGDVHVLTGVDLDVARGAIVALLGSNGAGKTTAVRILSTLLAADGGTARVDDLDVSTEGARVRAAISLTGQFAAVDEVLTGRENLVLIARLRHVADPRRVADDLLARFSLTDAAGRAASTYSGGMRRRLDIAMSLVGDPSVVFLDEPTTGLDPQARIEVWDAVRALAASGTTVLLTTQYLEEADRLADVITVIDHGRVIARGTAEELKDAVRGSTLALQVRHDGDLDAAVRALASVGTAPPSVERRTRRASVAVDRGPDVMVGLLERLGGEGVELSDLGLRRSSLDEVFLALTGHEADADADTEPQARAEEALR